MDFFKYNYIVCGKNKVSKNSYVATRVVETTKFSSFTFIILTSSTYINKKQSCFNLDLINKGVVQDIARRGNKGLHLNGDWRVKQT